PWATLLRCGRTIPPARFAGLLAIAAVLDGASREEAATIGGMARDTLRGWVMRFDETGRDGIINIPSPGVTPQPNSRHKAFLARLVDEGPIPAIHWRGALAGVLSHHAGCMRSSELSVLDDTIYRALKKLGFSHMSARPKAYKQNAEAMDAFEKTSPSVWRKFAAATQRLGIICKLMSKALTRERGPRRSTLSWFSASRAHQGRLGREPQFHVGPHGPGFRVAAAGLSGLARSPSEATRMRWPNRSPPQSLAFRRCRAAGHHSPARCDPLMAALTRKPRHRRPGY